MRDHTIALHRRALKAGLYIVATPIGNLADMTLRALETLHCADAIACEDTRISGRLLHHYGIDAKLMQYHEHNAAKMRPEIVSRIAAGAAIALVSDAGTPLISDPGYKLVRDCVEAGLHVEAAPGASSVMTALAIAALPTDRFVFEGFLPTKESAARKVLGALKGIEATLVFFESARRVAETLTLMRDVLGDGREAVVARELTKLYEEAVRGTLGELSAHYTKVPEPRGEIVLVVGPPLAVAEATEDELDTALTSALARASVKEAVAEVSATLSLPRGKVYARALELKQKP